MDPAKNLPSQDCAPMAYFRRCYASDELNQNWPSLVSESSDIQSLYAEGNITLFDSLLERGLAIVGTRYPQPRSIQHLREVMRMWSREPAEKAPIIVSGFARGIDRAAHEAAVEFELPTVAILGSGLDFPYPAHHRELKKAILNSAAGGLLLSEVAWEEKAFPSQFLARNRLIARWSKATWIVEASIRSGAMNTARWARESDRDCYATPAFPGDSSLAGNELLLDLYQAAPVWGTHSFGQTWLRFSTLGQKDVVSRSDIRLDQNEPRHSSVHSRSLGGLSSAARELFEVICVREHASGGADSASLLERSLARGWSPPEFYQALDELIQAARVVELRNGLFISKR